MKAVTQHNLKVRKGKVFLKSIVDFGDTEWATETELKSTYTPNDLRGLMQLHCGKLSNHVGNAIVGKV